MSGPGLNLPKSDPRYRALSLVRAPAFLLLCAGALNILFCVVLLALAALEVPSFFPPPPGQPPEVMELSWKLLLQAGAAIICGVLSTWGALSALSLRGYGLAIVGAITACFCLSPTVCIGIPATCWTLYILSRPDVRQAFAP
ncbi:MAG: hypothetical protein JXB05_21890 [Myxococcaceae bacterium]|nr:hypothetical protein [Myxococcaceae bacterium]